MQSLSLMLGAAELLDLSVLLYLSVEAALAQIYDEVDKW